MITGRHRRMFNFDWQFFLGDADGANELDFVDRGWEAVDLPHDYSIYGDFDEIVKQQFEAANEYGVPLLSEMVDLIHRHEPTRKVTAALFPAREQGRRFNNEKYATSEPAEMAFHMDVVSVNYMERCFDRDHRTYPQMSFILSEATTGMGAQPRQRVRESTGRKGTLPFFAFDHSFTVGLCYWGGIDYVGEAGNWPSKGWRRGFVDLAGWPKPSAHLVRANFSDQPVVYTAVTNISEEEKLVWNDVELVSAETASHWNWEAGQIIQVTTFSNCESVELILNDRSLGRREVTRDDCMALTWEMPFEPGTLVANGRNGEAEVDRYDLQTAGKPCRLQIAADRDVLAADGLDLAHLTVTVTDANGLRVPSAAHTIHFTVDGAGSNAGVDNGDLMGHERWQADSRSAYKGRAQLVVRAAREPGDVMVTARAEGLTTGQLAIRVRQCQLGDLEA